MNNDRYEEELRSLPDACASFAARRLARVLSSIYDKALLPTRLNSAQFSLLAVLRRCGDVQLVQLANLLDLERTTLTRNIAVLQKDGLARVVKGSGDARTRIISITPSGEQRLALALPLWRTIQAEVDAELVIGKLSEIGVTGM